MTTIAQVKQVLAQTYTKIYAIDQGNKEFHNLSSTRKEVIIRSLYIGHLTIRRMWESEGCLHWEVVAAEHHKWLEHYNYWRKDMFLDTGMGSPKKDGWKLYVVMVDRKLKWHCDCRWFSIHTDKDYCSHVRQVRLMNILRDYLNYFIYSYRFLLPDISYKKFLMDFIGNDEVYT
jgi:hypothetical protein